MICNTKELEKEINQFICHFEKETGTRVFWDYELSSMSILLSMRFGNTWSKYIRIPFDGLSKEKVQSALNELYNGLKEKLSTELHDPPKERMNSA